MPVPDPTQFKADESGRITVGTGQVAHPAFATMLTALGIPSLALDGGAVRMDDDGSGNYAVVGAGALLGTAVPDASLYFEAQDDAYGYAFQLTGTLDTLSLGGLVERGIIPEHPRSAVDAVLSATFSGAKLIFDSEGETLFAGIERSDQEFELMAPLGLSLSDLGFQYARDYADEGGAEYLLNATLGIGGTTLPVHVRLPVDTSSPGTGWSVMPQTSLRLAQGMADVVEFLEGTGAGQAVGIDDWASFFPDELHALPDIFVHDVDIQVEPLTLKMQRLAFAVDTADAITLGDFSFDHAGAEVTLLLWQGSPQVSLILTGALSLNDYASLGITLSVPPNGTGAWTVDITGQVELDALADLDNLPTNTKVSEFHLPASFIDLESVDLRQFRMVYDPAAGFQSLELDLATVLTIGVSSVVALQNPTVQLRVDYPFDAAGSTRRRITGSFGGRVAIGGITFLVQADKQEAGWAFTGTLEGLMGVGAALDAIAGHFGIELPTSLRNFELTSLTIGFTTTAATGATAATGTGEAASTSATGSTGATASTGDAAATGATTSSGAASTTPTTAAASTSDFTFDCVATLPVDGKEVKAEFKLVVHEEGTGKHSVTASGTVWIGTRTFSLAFSKDNTSTLLVAAYGHEGKEALDVREELVEHVSTSLAPFIPAGLTVDFKSALFAIDRVSAATTTTDGSASSGSTSSTGTTATEGTEGTEGTAAEESAGDDEAAAAVPPAAPGTVYLFGIDIAAGLDLTAIPLIGSELPEGAQVRVDNLQIAVASGPLAQAEVAKINALLPAVVTPLPSTGLGQGINVGAGMLFGGEPQTVAVPVAAPGTTPAAAPAPATPPANVAPSDGAQWITLQKAFGPVRFNRVGVKYADGAAWFLLDAALSAAGLTLSMEGLAFGSPLDSFEPRFDLKGIGIDYASGPVEIGGAFARQTLKDAQGKEYDEYDGAAVLRTEELTLSALGSYAELEGHPSLFVYAVLDYPLGGPAFFFVTGLAAGFGYNRSLAMPALEQVSRFPLVSAAMSAAAPPKTTADVTKMLSSLTTYLTPRLDEVFLAAGVRFTSFKLVDSFVLAVVSFGDEFEVDVLGLSTLVLPTPVPGEPAVTPLAEVQMALRATFQPSQGFLGVSAQLTSASFVISRACHLTGGFAFYTWFSGEHAGDFVLSLGGYHPSFQRPSHYPAVPRLGLSWQVSRELSVQGGLYCALTPSLLMAGGEMKATYHDGSLQASFTAGMDFILSWKPYHYDFTVHVDVGVKYTYHFFGKHHINVDVSADLHCWGPDFSGKVHIDLDVISFTIPFGDDKKKSAAPIPWSTFTQSFLPAQTAVCTVAVTGGLLAGGSGDGDLGVVDPRRFRLVTDAVVPSSTAHVRTALATESGVAMGADGAPLPYTWDAGKQKFVQAAGASTRTPSKVGVGPVGLKQGVASTHSITVQREGEEGKWVDVVQDFAFTPVLKNVPWALWGNELSPGLKSPRMVENVLSGFALTPAAGPAPGATAVVDRANLRFDQEDVRGAYAWGAADPAFASSGLDDEARRDRIAATLASESAAQARATLCDALGLAPVTVDAAAAAAAADSFLVAPELYPAAQTGGA